MKFYAIIPFFICLFIPINAANFVVDTKNDVIDANDGLLSISEAIEAANANGENDVITFDPKIKNIQIAATLVANEGDLEIQGPIILDANDLFRVFQIDSGNITFTQVTFFKGLAPDGDDDGGGVLINSGTTASFLQCTFTENSAVGDGGAIQALGSITEISDCLFEKNTTFSNGGAINVGVASTITLIDATVFKFNEVIVNGGAIFNNNTINTISNTIFQSNQAGFNFGLGSDGGAIFNDNTIDLIENCTFFNNKADGDGGAYFDNGGGGPIEINLCLFNKNLARTENGGSISAQSGSDISLQETVFKVSQTSINGGAIFTDGTMAILDCSFEKNKTKVNNGGGIFADANSSVTIEKTLFVGNKSANQGGGTYTNSGAAFNVENCTFSGNSAKNDGGGHFDDTAVTVFSFCTFTKNKAKLTGGAITISAGSDVTLNSTLVAANSSKQGKDLFGNNFTDGGFNLIQNPDDHNLQDGVNSNIVGQKAQIAGLKDNGGATKTHALKANSPAVDTGDDSQGVVEDQRSFARDATPDIGAFEFGAVETRLVQINFFAILQDTCTQIEWNSPNVTGVYVWRKDFAGKFKRISPFLTNSEKNNSFEDFSVNKKSRYMLQYITNDGKQGFSEVTLARKPQIVRNLRKISKR